MSSSNATASTPHVPPHHSDLTLTTLTEDQLEEYGRAVARGFHSELKDEDLEAEREAVDPKRYFGFRSGDRWVATTASFARQLTVPGGSVGTAAVTEVTVAPGFRRRGLLRQMMKHQLTEIAEPVALLWASESVIYGRFGYGQATRMLQLSGLTSEIGFLPEVDLGSGSTDEVSQADFLAAAAPLREALLPDRPGHLNRDDIWWRRTVRDPEHWRRGAGPLRFALHFAEDGTPDGFATFRIKQSSSITDQGSEVSIGDLDATGPQAYAALWRWLLDLDLVRAFSRHAAPTDEPLLQLAANPRMIKAELSDAGYARLVDVPAALQARSYTGDLDLVLEVDDAFLPDSGGRFRLVAGSDGASVTRTDRSPDLTLTARQLGAVYLGGTGADELARAGLLAEHTPGAAHAVSIGFGWPRAPHCPDFF